MTRLEAADAIRAACLAAASAAYEDAGIQGVCAEGRWEAAVGAARSLDLAAVLHEAEAAHAPPPPDQLQVRAAELAFAMLRFTQGALTHFRGQEPPEGDRAGEDWFMFTPSWRRTPRDQVVPFLAGLGTPALLFPGPSRGIVSLLLEDETTGERRRWMRKNFSNQVACLDSSLSQMELAEDSPVVLEFEDESHVFPLAAVRRWAESFSVGVGWSVCPCVGHPLGKARVMLYRSDGENSWGASCPVRSTLPDPPV